MLSYIWCQLHRIAAFSRCFIIKCRMSAFKVVGVYIFTNGNSDFLDIIILCQIDLLILEASKPALNHDIVRSAAFSIHALADAVFFYEINVLLTCELTTLIRIQDLWFCYLECFFQGVDNHSGVKYIINFPANDATAISVNNGSQIQKTSLDRNICNIDRPCLIRLVYNGITKEIRTYLCLLHTLGKIHLSDCSISDSLKSVRKTVLIL